MTDNIHFKIEGGYQYEAIKNGICFQRSWHLLKYQKAIELLQIKSTDKVLDAACGSGVLSNQLAENYKVEVTGADFSDAAIQFCKQQYKEPNLQFIKLDLQQRYFSENSFDKIVMLEVLEHLTPETAAVILPNLLFYLKPGGKLVLSTPNKRSFWPLIEFMLDALHLTPKMKDEQHVKLYNPNSLKKVLEQSGFKVRKIKPSHFVAPWLSFLGLKTAEKIHSIEQKSFFLPGSLLFAVAEK